MIHGCPDCAPGIDCGNHDDSPSALVVAALRHRAEKAEAEVAQLQQRVTALEEEISWRRHEDSLIAADTQRGVTDCSTPLFQRVRNIVAQLEQAEARIAIAFEAYDREARWRAEAEATLARVRALREQWREKAKAADSEAGRTPACLFERRNRLRGQFDGYRACVTDLDQALTGEAGHVADE